MASRDAATSVGLGNDVWRWGTGRYGWAYYLRSYEGGTVYLRGDSTSSGTRPKTKAWGGGTGPWTRQDYGAGAWTTESYLHQHPRETSSKFNWRRDVSYYANFARPVIDVPLDYIYSREAIQSTPDSAVWEKKYQEDFDAFMRDATGRRETMHEFMYSQAAKLAAILGHVYVLVDKPAETRMSKAKYVEAPGDRPYVRTVYPWNVLDWELDPMNRLLWVVIREPLKGQRKPEENFIFNPGGARGDTAYTYLILSPNEWARYNEGGKKIAGGSHGLGRVPLSIIYTAKSMIYQQCGVSVLSDIAPVNQWIYNLCSMVQECHAKQSFAILALPRQRGATQSLVELGSENAYYYDTQRGEQAPTFIAPPTTHLQDMASWIDRLIREVWRMAVMRQIGGTLNDSTQEQSGMSKVVDFQDSDRMFKKRALHYESGETDILDIWSRWTMDPADYKAMQKDGTLPSVEYGKDYELRPLKRQLEEAIMLVSEELELPDRFKQVVQERVIDASGFVRGDDALRREVIGSVQEQIKENSEARGVATALKMMEGEEEPEPKPAPRLTVPVGEVA